MKVFYENEFGKLYYGDAFRVLKSFPAESVQMAITSPPYWRLRDYQTEGQIGLEKTPEEYVEKLVLVFRELRRILRKDGTFWLNIGDCYNGSGGAGGDYSVGGLKEGQPKYPRREIKSLKPKDLIGIPWRMAFALQADGWWLRQDIVWSKKNCMPESVSDRFVKSHEFLFLLTKASNYFFDLKAVEELADYDGRKDTVLKGSYKYKESVIPGKKEHTMASAGHERWRRNESGEFIRNKRSVWSLPTATFKGEHYAVFPEELVEPCVLAGSREGDVVLDPFMGSGTVAVVAHSLKRRWLGIELSEKSCQLASDRIERSTFESFIPLFEMREEF